MLPDELQLLSTISDSHKVTQLPVIIWTITTREKACGPKRSENSLIKMALYLGPSSREQPCKLNNDSSLEIEVWRSSQPFLTPSSDCQVAAF